MQQKITVIRNLKINKIKEKEINQRNKKKAESVKKNLKHL